MSSLARLKKLFSAAALLEIGFFKGGDELCEGEDYMPITTAERTERTYTHRGYRMGIEQGGRPCKLETARKMLVRGVYVHLIADLDRRSAPPLTDRGTSIIVCVIPRKWQNLFTLGS